jgi:hypothetical protein
MNSTPDNDPTSSASKSRASSSADPFSESLKIMQNMSNIFAGSMATPQQTAVAATHSSSNEREIQKKMNSLLSSINFFNVLVLDYQIEEADAANICRDKAMYLDIFCTPGKGFDASYVKEEFVKLDEISRVSVHKLFMLLRDYREMV